MALSEEESSSSMLLPDPSIPNPETIPSNLPTTVIEAKKRGVKQIRIRASTIAVYDFCKPMTWLSIVQGAREDGNMATVQGSIQHYIREYMNTHNEQIQKELEKVTNLFSIYDYMVDLHNKALDWALMRMREKLDYERKKSGQTMSLTETDQVVIESQARAEAHDQALMDAVELNSIKTELRGQAAVRYMYAKRLREFGLGWDYPKRMQIETEIFTKLDDEGLEGWTIWITGHPDKAIEYRPRTIQLFDYKTGTPASADTFVEPQHELEQNVYGLILSNMGYECPLATIVYTKAQGGLDASFRPFDLKLEYLTNIVLPEIFSWIILGKKPDRIPISYCSQCQKKTACQERFQW